MKKRLLSLLLVAVMALSLVACGGSEDNEQTNNDANTEVKDTITFTPVTATKDVSAYDFIIRDKKGNTVYSVKEDKKLPVNFV